MGTPEVEVRRSKRRRRTVSAYRDGDKVVVLIPASMSRKQEAEWVDHDAGPARAVREAASGPPTSSWRAGRASSADAYLGALARPDIGPLGRQPERPLGVVHPG